MFGVWADGRVRSMPTGKRGHQEEEPSEEHTQATEVESHVVRSGPVIKPT